MMNRSTALFPTGKGYNPTKREGHYADPAQVAYVLRFYGRFLDPPTLRVATSFGSIGWPLGYRGVTHHDQTRRTLGEFVVDGIAYPDGHSEGTVPDRKLPHWVFK